LITCLGILLNPPFPPVTLTPRPGYVTQPLGSFGARCNNYDCRTTPGVRAHREAARRTRRQCSRRGALPAASQRTRRVCDYVTTVTDVNYALLPAQRYGGEQRLRPTCGCLQLVRTHSASRAQKMDDPSRRLPNTQANRLMAKEIQLNAVHSRFVAPQISCIRARGTYGVSCRTHAPQARDATCRAARVCFCPPRPSWPRQPPTASLHPMTQPAGLSIYTPYTLPVYLYELSYSFRRCASAPRRAAPAPPAAASPAPSAMCRCCSWAGPRQRIRLYAP
jgi:hypothetical protein